MNTQQALQLAFQHLNSGNLVAANPIFNSVLQREPNNFSALNGRGFVALQQNQLRLSEADFAASLLINPKQIFAQKMLGIVLGAMGRFEESMQSFQDAIALDHKDPEIYFNRANFRFQAGQADLALKDLDEAIRLKPSYLEARSNRANLLILQGLFAAAEKDLAYLTNKVKNNPELWVALGLARLKLGKPKEALQCNERALKISPQHPDALMNNSSITFEMQDFVSSVIWAEKAINATPSRAEAHYSLAKALAELAQFERALTSYDQAIALNSNYPEAFMGRGLVNAALRQVSAAEADYDRAIALKPDYEDAIFNKSYMHLEQHNFVEGWQGYERRLGFPKFKDSLLPDLPVWQGEKINGVLLVRGEQGLGDQIIFASVLPDLLNRHPRVCLQVDPRLMPLFERTYPTIKVLPKTNDRPGEVVAQIPLGSLPKLFRQNSNSFASAQIPYLKSDRQRTESFKMALAPKGEKIIGINWRSFKNRYADDKSITLEDLLPVFKIPGCVFVNLQYGDVNKEVSAACSEGVKFSEAVSIDLTNDIDGVASLVEACDEIVSISNSTVHLAGALNKPVMLMLPYRTGKLWYWSEAKGEGSLWYPSIKTFHQSAQGDWAGTIDNIVNCLKH
jgi:tetratricopeptide (TPR) repeat protein